MDLEQVLSSNLFSGEEVVGIACIDVRSGMMLASATHGFSSESLLEALSSSATCVNELTATPAFDGEPESSEETFVVGARFLQALVRAPRRPDLVVLGIAPKSGNLGLLLSLTRSVAQSVGT